MPLTRKHVVAAAIELIEAAGLEAVAMRRLATELGCGLIPLYDLVPSTAALLDAVADEIMAQVEVPAVPAAAWDERVRAQATAFRQVASTYPRCAMIAAARPGASNNTLRPAENVLASLRDAGFGGQDAVRITRVLAAFMMGSLLREAGVAPSQADSAPVPSRPRPRPYKFPHVTALWAELNRKDPDTDFEFGLDLLLHAFRSQLRQAAAAGSA